MSECTTTTVSISSISSHTVSTPPRETSRGFGLRRFKYNVRDERLQPQAAARSGQRVGHRNGKANGKPKSVAEA